MRILAASEPSKADKLNEDWFSASPNLVVVLDGATARTDTGCVHGVSWYAAQLGAAVSAQASDTSIALPAALSAAIKTVADKHPECDLKSPGTPSAAVAILRRTLSHLEYLVLGDVGIVLASDSHLSVIIDDRVEKTAQTERQEADEYPIGSAEKADALIRMKHAELAARNTEGGFWVSAADPTIVSHAIIESVPIESVTRSILLTDGAARLVRMFNDVSWEEMLDLLENQGPGEALRRVRKLEESDPIATRWPRNKKSDDATLVYAADLR
ncbi:protein phosphatase 2C domain-containing protein [Micromonospora sp. HUAS LYJ1]|uniref:protein phosphatase 2C domain-containing protein n=1 Tax=Micromonospora sp. HUAS LYJ1 TaxID=3061626 RepID=UPI00267162A2|nr:protein phosphatase 2C domain-containing protein [Micromonospora sp. HUAS LYJ1]WKU02859.1 protein phosphatase 2C domain-containing protein [Micromonospora sp. HUAS LYJ1]